jgi:ATP-dependent RNA helicase DeaD
VPAFARNLPGPKPERGERTERRGREERSPAPDAEPTIAFRINIGREGNADPRWLIPLLCRRGHVTKKDIGTIKIFDRETRFGIVERAAGRFASAVRRSNGQPDDTDSDLRIEPMDGQGHAAPSAKRGRETGERRAPERKSAGKKPFRQPDAGKERRKTKDRKESGRSVAGKWTGKKN